MRSIRPRPPAPIVIAHRGASGYLPEHTLPAKALAYAMGAHFLEQDVIATRDGALIVFHDLWLDDLTDVADRFPGRARSDGRHYCIDFDLAEIRTLGVTERRLPGTNVLKYPGRFPLAGGRFGIPTLDEEIRFIVGLNRSTGRSVGLYTEIKDPGWHREQGIDLTRQVLATLAAHGFSQHADPVFVQCFDAAELRRCRTELGARLKLIQLLGSAEPVPDDAALRDLAQVADGIGPSLSLLLRDPATMSKGFSGFASRAHAAGLLVHPYTLRYDALPPGCDSFESLLELVFFAEQADGAFTDFPDRVVRYLDGRANAVGTF